MVINTSLIKTGIINLNRENVRYEAGFSIANQSLESLYEHYSLLHPSEKSYAKELKFDRRKHSYLLGRVSAKLAFQALINDQKADLIAIDYGVFQFPVVKNVQGHNLQVSISHCDNIGLALMYPEEHPLGIDIEKVEEKIIETLAQQLTSKEKNILKEKGLFTEAGHTLLWTVKEGLSKIFRTGLMMDFKTLEIDSIVLKEGVYESAYTHCGQYKAMSAVIGTYVCTVVAPKNTNIDLNHFWQSLEELATKSTNL